MKSIKKVVAILLILTTMTGCVKYKNTMTINDDKSMNFEGTYLIHDKIIETISSMGSGGETTIEDNIDKDKLKERGITISDKKESGYTGVSFSKKYDNIDNVSNEAGKEIIISDYLNDDFDDSVLFKVEKGFLKNKYTAKFSFNSEVTTDDGDLTSYVQPDNEQLAMGNGLDGTAVTNPNDTTVSGGYKEDNSDPATGTNDNSTTTIDDNLGGNTGVDSDYDKAYEELSKLASEMEFSFTVNLPSTPISNNATKTDNDGKTLVWNIESNKVTTIEFAFELKNMTNYYILYGGIAAGVIIVIVIIIMIINKGKKGKEVIPAQNEPIHADYDPSIAAAIPNPALVNGGPTSNVNNEVASTAPVTNEPTQTVQQEPVQPQTPVQTEVPAEPKVEVEIPVQEPVEEPVSGPIGNTNTEPQAHIIPEVTVEPQVIIPETEPTFVTPDNTKEEPIVIPEEKPEIKIDTPQTIDMNQN